MLPARLAKLGVFILAVAAWDKPAAAQTHLHYDLGGVSTKVGKVWLHSRSDGRVTTSIRVGRSIFHDSNYGVSGMSYEYASGRLDLLTGSRGEPSFNWYTPYSQPYLYRPWRVAPRYQPRYVPRPIAHWQQ
jgi:hypothetical protein